MEYAKIDKRVAYAMYEDGFRVKIVPKHMMPNGMWVNGHVYNEKEHGNFLDLIDSLEKSKMYTAKAGYKCGYWVSAKANLYYKQTKGMKSAMMKCELCHKRTDSLSNIMTSKGGKMVCKACRTQRDAIDGVLRCRSCDTAVKLEERVGNKCVYCK